MAVSPQLMNQVEVESMILDAFRARAEWAGFSALSSLIEARVVDTGPAWIRAAQVLEVADDCLRPLRRRSSPAQVIATFLHRPRALPGGEKVGHHLGPGRLADLADV